MLIAFALYAGIAAGQPQQTPRSKHELASQSQPSGVSISAESESKQPNFQPRPIQEESNTPSGKASFPRSQWWFDSNWWLVIVGICTAGVIGWQSFETRRAADASQKAVEAALKQTAMSVTKERARIVILFPDEADTMTIWPDKMPSPGSFRVNLKNIGGTPAYKITAAYDAFAIELHDAAPKSDGLFQLVVPDVIEGDTSRESGPISIDSRFLKERAPEHFYVYLRGVVEYNDIFKPERNRTKFLLRRGFQRMRPSEAVSHVFWESVGEPEDNENT
jgi:hypothetical protein